MTEPEIVTANPTSADYLASIRRLQWLVIAIALLGAVPGILSLRSDLSKQHRVVMVVSYGYIPEPASKALLGIRDPSADAAILTRDRNSLAPDLKDDEVTISGDDGAGRLSISVTDDSDAAATRKATELATIFVTQARADLQARLDRLTAYDMHLIADAEKRLAAATPNASSTAVLPISLEIVQRVTELASFQQLQQPKDVFTDPEVFDRQSSSGSVTSIGLVTVGLAFGALFGAALAAGIGLLDRRVRTRSNLESTVRGVEVLAVMPAAPHANALLAAAGALNVRYGGRAAVVGIVNVGKGVGGAASVADQLNACVVVLTDPAATAGVTAEAPPGSLPEDQNILVSVRRMDGVVIVAQSGITRDSDLVEATASLRLVGVPVVGQILVGVPARELATARAARRPST